MNNDSHLLWIRKNNLSYLNSFIILKGRFIFLIMISGLFLFEGCYHARINASGEPATEYNKVTVHSIAWGLVQENPIPDDCISGALDEVRVSTNFGYSLINVITLGFWKPMDVEWRCAKTPPPVPDEI